jgi:hypothetical protein
MALDPDITKRRGFTEKREAFCQLVIAIGVDYKAYLMAYDADNMSDGAARVAAYHLKRTDYCSARLEELREGVALDAKFEAVDAYREAIQSYRQAMEAGKFAAASSFLALACKITGLGVDKLDLTSGGKQIEQPTKIMIGVLGKDD